MSLVMSKEIADLYKIGDRLDEKLLAEATRTLVRQYQLATQHIRAEIAKMYAKYGSDVDLSTMTSFNRLVNLEKNIAKELKKLTRESQSSIRSSIKDLYTQSYEFHYFAMERTVQASLNFGILSTEQINAAVLNPVDRITWPVRLRNHTEAFNQRVRETVTRALIQGTGPRQAARDIAGLGEKSASDAVRILRTEGQRARSAGRIAAFDESEKIAEELGIKTTRRWVATLDNRTRDLHAEIDGQDANAENIFTFADGTTTTGAGLSGVAEHDINCRCTTILAFIEVPQRVRRDNLDKKNVPFTTFSEWREARTRDAA